MKKDITALFCFVDDFCKISEQWINKSFLPLNDAPRSRATRYLKKF